MTGELDRTTQRSDAEPTEHDIQDKQRPDEDTTARSLASRAVPPVVEWGPASGMARREEREVYGPSL